MPTITQPMQATEYTLVVPPALTPSDPQSVATFRTQITLQTQGDPAIFDARTPLSALVLAFASAYDVATQAILRLDDGRAVLLFDHETRDLIAPEPIDESVWGEILKLRDKITAAQDIATPTPTSTIDLAALWSRIKESDDLLARTKLFVKSLPQALSPATTLHLHGDIPALPLLAAIYLSRPSGYTVEYQDNTGAILTLFA